MIRTLPTSGGRFLVEFVALSQMRADIDSIRLATDEETARANAAADRMLAAIRDGAESADIALAINACGIVLASVVKQQSLPLFLVISTIAQMLEPHAIAGHAESRQAIEVAGIASKLWQLPAAEHMAIARYLCQLDRAGWLAIGHAAAHIAGGMCSECPSCEAERYREAIVGSAAAEPDSDKPDKETVH